MKPSELPLQIALIAADPFTTGPDQLEEEAEIISELFQSANRPAKVSCFHAYSEKELALRLRESPPQIVEITAHGSPSTQIVMEDGGHRIRQKTSRSIAALVSQIGQGPECVIFNNCYSKGNEQALHECADHFIQVQSDGVFDISLGFARSFYESVSTNAAYGVAVGHAFNLMKEAGVPIGSRSGYWRRSLEAVGMKSEVVEMANEKASSGTKPAPVKRMIAAVSASQSIAPSPKPEPHTARKHTVWFATNRKPLDQTKPENGFGSDYDEALHYGRCEVVIPKYHKRGSIGTRFWQHWPPWQSDRVELLQTTALSVDSFWADLSSRMTSLAKENKYILLFIHGYNVSFQQAVIRAGQMGADLNVLGATALFSWPSKGRARSYPADEASVAPSAKYLSGFLQDLAAKAGAEQVHVVAHSMGNRAFLSALSSMLAKVAESTALRFNQFFLAAPDIDVREFKQLASAYAKLSERTTMYVSAKDKALWGSKLLHEYPRAGYHPPVTVVDGVDTIEVSNIDVSFLGHSYIAQAEDVLRDMYSLMLANPSPERRMGLDTAVDSSTGQCFWRMKP
jgi:esterase/lipase superfamily enzyme